VCHSSSLGDECVVRSNGWVRPGGVVFVVVRCICGRGIFFSGDPCPVPFRDNLASAFERADRLAHENALLRARLRRGRLHWIQWALGALVGLCAAAIGYLVVATG
jgi:hypothetical protein